VGILDFKQLVKKIKKFFHKSFHSLKSFSFKKKTPDKHSLLHKNKTHINHFRNEDNRVFLANPYFAIDLRDEIEWHRSHIKKLKNYAVKPHEWIAQFTSEEELGEDRKEHFREQVVENIPFHSKILEDHEKRLDFILSIINLGIYQKIVDITKKYGGLPEYFVYSKLHDDFFFVIEKASKEKNHWAFLVKEKYKICDIVYLDKKHNF
jgi:hypothetical protein